jgi:DNA-binding NarL/FixJ family response regulator
VRADVTVLCVDDQNVVRKCIVALLEQEPGFRVVAEARTVESALECFAESKPDVTVISLQNRGCLQTIRAIRRLDVRARIAVYAKNETEAMYLALEAGTAGFVLKDASAADLIRVITKVHGRSAELREGIKAILDARNVLPTLSAREIEMLECLTQGLRTPAIAATLRRSEHTVKMHMKNIYKKLGVRGRAAAVMAAFQRGYLQLGDSRKVSSETLDKKAPGIEERAFQLTHTTTIEWRR